MRKLHIFRAFYPLPLQWRHNELDGVSNHRCRHCLLNCWRRSKKTSKLRVTGLCARNSPVTGEFPAQKASNAEYVSFWWRHHDDARIHQDRKEHQQPWLWLLSPSLGTGVVRFFTFWFSMFTQVVFFFLCTGYKTIKQANVHMENNIRMIEFMSSINLLLTTHLSQFLSGPRYLMRLYLNLIWWRWCVNDVQTRAYIH